MYIIKSGDYKQEILNARKFFHRIIVESQHRMEKNHLHTVKWWSSEANLQAHLNQMHEVALGDFLFNLYFLRTDN